MLFKNRQEAARRLAERLARYRGVHPIILAIPRGAVPIGRILAEELGGELDVVLVRKIGAPGNPELAIGSVAESGEVVVSPFIAVSLYFQDFSQISDDEVMEILEADHDRVAKPV